MDQREFIGEPIEVVLPAESRPLRDPPAPVEFNWRGTAYRVEGSLEEWWDFTRLSRRQRAYGEGYQRKAPRRGSYGMGRRYFLVATAGGRFLIYYDRRPTPGNPGGRWVLLYRLRE